MNLYSGLIWITAIIVGSTAAVVYIGSNKQPSKYFVFSLSLVVIWITACGFFASTTSYIIADLLIRATYFLGVAIAASFVYFLQSFSEERAPSFRFVTILGVLQVISFALLFFTDLVLYQPFNIDITPLWGWHTGKLFFVFESIFYGTFLWGLVILYNKYRTETQLLRKRQLRNLIYLVLVGSIPPSITSIILPRFGYFDINWVAPVSQIFWVPILAYSIVKNHLFETRVILIELVIFILWILILVRTTFARSVDEVVVQLVLFVVIVVLSMVLINTLMNSIKHQERIQELSEELKRMYRLMGEEIDRDEK